MSPRDYKAFIAERAEADCPVPPPQSIKQPGHHWLVYRPEKHGSGGSPEYMVVQWSPTQLVWYYSNEIATCAKPIHGSGLLEGWEWVAEIPLPN